MEDNIITCTNCLSTDIVQTQEGYVCRSCGIVWADDKEFVETKMFNEFKINDYLSLKLEGRTTNIYVKGVLFQQCKFLLLNIPVDEMVSFDDIDSIDEAAEKLDRSMEGSSGNVLIPPETEFWGHCSNLQVWYENNYDTRLLHSNLAFPLLKKLVEAGDVNAERVFKEEIVKRFIKGNETVQTYLKEQQYLVVLKDEEIKQLVLELFERKSFHGLDLLDLNLVNRIKFQDDEVVELIFDSNYEFKNWVNIFLKERLNAGIIIHRVLYFLIPNKLNKLDEVTKSLYKTGFKKCFFCVDDARKLYLWHKTYLSFFDVKEREEFFNAIDFEIVNGYLPKDALRELSHFAFDGSCAARQLLHDKIKEFFKDTNEDMIRHIIDNNYFQYLESDEIDGLLKDFDLTIITEQELNYDEPIYDRLRDLAKFGYLKANHVLKKEFIKRFKEDQLRGLEFFDIYLRHLKKAEVGHFLEELNYNTIINQDYSHTFNTLSMLEELGIPKARRVFKQLYGSRSLVNLFTDLASLKQEIPYEKKLKLLQCILLPSEMIFLQELQLLIDKDIKVYIDPRHIRFPSIVIEQKRISQIRMEGQNIEELPKSIGNLDSLKILNLKYNRLTHLPEEISRNTSLEELLLRKNPITELPKTIGKLIRLQKLDLSRNKLETLPRSIAQLQNLKYLNLNFNNFQVLSKKIGNIKSLKVLYCDYNQLTNLPNIFHKLRKLRRIDLQGNRLKTIPRTLLSLNSLRKIALTKDYLDEETIDLLESVVEPLEILFGKYIFSFYYGGGLFWPSNDEAKSKYGYPARLDHLPLSQDIIEEFKSLQRRWNPRKKVLEEFKIDTRDTYLKAVKQLGPNFQVKFHMEGYGLPYER